MIWWILSFPMHTSTNHSFKLLKRLGSNILALLYMGMAILFIIIKTQSDFTTKYQGENVFLSSSKFSLVKIKNFEYFKMAFMIFIRIAIATYWRTLYQNGLQKRSAVLQKSLVKNLMGSVYSIVLGDFPSLKLGVSKRLVPKKFRMGLWLLLAALYFFLLKKYQSLKIILF